MDSRMYVQDDVEDYLYGGDSYLNNRRREKQDLLIPVSHEYIQRLKTECIALMNNYGRTITVTFNDNTLFRDSKRWILQQVKNIMDKHTRNYILVEDYAPTDGRYHLHGVFTPRTIKKIHNIKRDTKRLGFIRIGLADKIDNADYIFKIYETNTKTVINQLQKVKLYRKAIIMDEITNYAMNLFRQNEISKERMKENMNNAKPLIDEMKRLINVIDEMKKQYNITS